MLKRYLFTFTLLIAIPIFVILVLFFRMFEHALIDQLSHQSLEATQQIAEGLDEEAQRIALMASALAHNSILFAELAAYTHSADPTASYQASRRIAEHLDTVFQYTNQVGGFFFFFANKDILYHRNLPLPLNDGVKQADWYQQALREPGKTHILQTFALHGSAAPAGLFVSCAISPGKEALKQGIEMIVVSFKSRVYSEILLSPQPNPQNDFLILNAQQEMILPSSLSEQSAFASLDLAHLDGAATLQTPNASYLVIARPLPYCGMKLIRILDYASLTSKIRAYSRYARMTLFGLVALFLLYTVAFFRSMVRPLRQVIQTMKAVGKGDMDARVETDGMPELTTLCTAFNQMVEKIRRLTTQIEQKERQRAQAEIDALQFQINPHFLSNTLNAIRMMATMIRAENIQKMTAATMAILNASFRTTGAFARLDEQITQLESYIYIMKVRFGDRFEMEFDCDEEARYCFVMKMLIQPLLENSILHGIREIEGQGRIRMTARRQADRLEIAVSDNGVGMSPEAIAAAWTPEEHQHKGFQCIGIRNVHDRIRLYHGDAYGLHIVSEPGYGTTVTCVLPIITKSAELKA